MSADAAAAGAPITVEIAWSTGPRLTDRLQLQLPAGSTVRVALQAGRLGERLTGQLDAAALDAMAVGLWGRIAGPDEVLRDGDRLELLRGLQVDPKEARRLRYRRDGVRPKRKAPRR